jgi:hypothetical protein
MVNRVKFAKCILKGKTKKGTPIKLAFEASKARGNFVAVEMGWQVGELKHLSERIFGPIEDKNAFGQVNKWIGDICKQAGVDADIKWHRKED